MLLMWLPKSTSHHKYNRSHKICTLLYLVVIQYWVSLPIFFRIIYWHWGNYMTAQMPLKQPWRKWVYHSHKSTGADDKILRTQSTAGTYAYFVGHAILYLNIPENVRHWYQTSQLWFNKKKIKYNRSVCTCFRILGMLAQLIVKATPQKNIKIPYYWPFIRDPQWIPLTKEPSKLKAYPFCDNIMISQPLGAPLTNMV